MNRPIQDRGLKSTLFPCHRNGTLGANSRADTTSLAIIEIDENLAGPPVLCDTEIGAQETTDFARLALSQS